MDSRLFRSINRFADRTSWAHPWVKGYATYGIALFAVIMLFAWWDARSSGEPTVAVAAVVWSGVAPLLSFVAVQVIGAVVDRARPTAVLANTHLLVSPTKDFSFPSDHSTAVGAISVALILAGPTLRRRSYGWVALGLAVLLAFSRVYVGAHYPGDVVAGLLLGAGIAIVGAPLARRLLVPLAEWARTTQLAPLVSP